MKTKLTLVLSALLLSISSHGFASDLQRLEIPASEHGQIEAKIKTALMKEIDFSELRDFTIDWSPTEVACLVAASEMDPDSQYGVCKVRVAAFMVEAQAAVTKNPLGYSAVIIYANVD